MAEQNFEQLQNGLEKTLASLDQEALENKVALTNQKYQEARAKIKDKLIAEAGVKPEEFRNWESNHEYEVKREGRVKSLAEKLKLFVKR